MIFSKAKWSNASEIRPYISVAASTGFDSLEAPLRNAFEIYIRKLLGNALTGKLIEYYASDTPTDKQKRFISLAQAANAFLAFWSEYDEMQLLIDDSGSHRQESDGQKTPFKYQEQALRSAWKTKGFNALDELLLFLEENAEDFPEFASSPNFTVSKAEIVRTTSEVNGYYWINNSRIIYLRLKPHLKIVTETIIAPRLGTIYDDMITALTGSGQVDQKYTKLRTKLVPVVVFYAIARLLKETGTLTERGLFFENLNSSADTFNTTPLNADQVAPQAAMAEADAISYWTIAEKFLKSDLSYTPAGGSRLPKFNNDNKKSFWS